MGPFQVGRQIPIQLNQKKASAATRQILGESPFAGPDLQDFIVGPEVHGFNDLPLEVSVYQEVLPE
jgi:hypothetical protein